MKIKISESEVREIIRKEIIKEQSSIEDADSFWSGAAGPEDQGAAITGVLTAVALAGGTFLAYKKFGGGGSPRLAAAQWLDRLATRNGLAPVVTLARAPARAGAMAIAPASSQIRNPRMTWRGLAERMEDIEGASRTTRTTSSGAAVTPNESARQAAITARLGQWEQTGNVTITRRVARDSTIGIDTRTSPAWSGTSASGRTTYATSRTVPDRITNLTTNPRRTPPGGTAGTGAWIDDAIPASFWDEIGLSATTAPRQVGGRWVAVRVAAARGAALTLAAEATEMMAGIQPFRQLGRSILAWQDSWLNVTYDTLQETILGSPEAYIGFVEGLNQSNLFSGVMQGSFTCGGLMTQRTAAGVDQPQIENYDTIKTKWQEAIGIIADDSLMDIGRISESEFRPAMATVMSSISNLPQGYTIYDLCKISADIPANTRRRAIVALRDFWGDLIFAAADGPNPSTQINQFLGNVYADFVVKVAAGENRGDVILYNPTESAAQMDIESDSVSAVSFQVDREGDVTPEDYATQGSSMGTQGIRLRQTSVLEKLASSQAYQTIAQSLKVDNAVVETTCPEPFNEETLSYCVAQQILPESEFARMFRADDPDTPGDESQQLTMPYIGGTPTAEQIPAEPEDVVIDTEQQTVTSGTPHPERRSIMELYEIFSGGMRRGQFPNLVLNDLGLDFMDTKFDNWYANIESKLPFQVFEQWVIQSGTWLEETGTSNMRQFVKKRLINTIEGYPLAGTLVADYRDIDNINNLLYFPRIMIGIDNDLALSNSPLESSGDQVNWQHFYSSSKTGRGDLAGQNLGTIASNPSHEHYEEARGQLLAGYCIDYTRMAGVATQWYPQLATWMRDKWK